MAFTLKGAQPLTLACVLGWGTTLGLGQHLTLINVLKATFDSLHGFVAGCGGWAPLKEVIHASPPVVHYAFAMFDYKKITCVLIRQEPPHENFQSPCTLICKGPPNEDF